MLLRAFKPEDLKTLFEIDAACFPPEVSYSVEELESFIMHRNSRTWVAEEDGKAIGFLVGQKTASQSVHIITIDVVREWRRHGVGATLLDAVEKWADRQRARLVALETAEDNHPAQAFYKKQGYAKAGKVEAYYANGAAAWVMIKRLGVKS